MFDESHRGCFITINNRDLVEFPWNVMGFPWNFHGILFGHGFFFDGDPLVFCASGYAENGMKLAEMEDLPPVIFNGDFPKENYLPGGKIWLVGGFSQLWRDENFLKSYVVIRVGFMWYSIDTPYGGCPKYLFPDSPQSLSQSRSNRGTTVSNRGRVCSSLIRSYT